MIELRFPRTDRVNPQICPVCSRLRQFLTVAITAGSPPMARAVVLDMHTHMIHGHPKDPRNKTPTH